MTESRQETAFSWDPGPLRAELGEGDVHVWLAALDQPQDRIEMFRDTLAEDELARASRFRFDDLRDRYVIGKGILRDILARYCQTEAQSIRFEYAPYGKPGLAGARAKSRVRFNVSHSGMLFMCAVAKGIEVGIDIEQIEPRRDFLKLADRFFAPREAAEIRGLPPEQQLDAFHACWTRKEAYLKGKGNGLAAPLDKFEVTLRPGVAAALLSSEVEPEDATRWKLFDVTPCPGYAAALAVEGALADVACWRWPPR